jgi:hypothetical protein
LSQINIPERESMNIRSLVLNNVVPAVLAISLLIVFGDGIPAQAAVGDEQGIWETWSSESYKMNPRESFQLRVEYLDMPTRRWLLVVDGADRNCDLSVLRVKGEELLYYKTDESRHEVSIPWGIGEEIIVVMTNRNHEGAFVVELLGPPKEENLASYSYSVNRALEAYTSGQRLKAKDQCRKALLENPNDGVAKVLLAGFLRESHGYSQAEALIQEALESELPPDMRALAENLQLELRVLMAPLPKEVQDGLDRAEEALGKNHPEEALKICDKLLGSGQKLSANSRSLLLVLRGRALEGLNRNFEAVDAFTQALNSDRAKDSQALAYYHMGNLFLKMENLVQAEGAFTIALQNGLPSGLDVQARESLQLVQDRLDRDR